MITTIEAKHIRDAWRVYERIVRTEIRQQILSDTSEDLNLGNTSTIFGGQEMSVSESWENVCCRCDSDVQVNLYPGKRACHITCGPCLYPDDWSKCNSCEIVAHCTYALSYLKSIRPNGIKKGCYFNEQLTGEETLYHALHFINAHQNLVERFGENRYLEDLKKANSDSPCLKSRN